MSNVIKHKKVGDINLQGELKLDALTASAISTPENGKKILFLDIADSTIKTMDHNNVVATIGGSSSSAGFDPNQTIFL